MTDETDVDGRPHPVGVAGGQSFGQGTSLTALYSLPVVSVVRGQTQLTNTGGSL